MTGRNNIKNNKLTDSSAVQYSVSQDDIPPYMYVMGSMFVLSSFLIQSDYYYSTVQAIVNYRVYLVGARTVLYRNHAVIPFGSTV